MTNPSAVNQEIRQALQQVLAAADRIGNAPEHHGLPAHARHDETRQGLILQAWEKLALLTGNHDLARENGFEISRPDMPKTGGLPAAAWTELQRSQPVVPLHQLRDPLQAMGIAMCHIGSASLQYGLIQGLHDLYGPSSMGISNVEQYLRAENDARIAHAVLHRTYTSLATGHPRSGGIRKHCRQANLWLTWERSRAALALGIDPPPEPSGDVQHGELDWDDRDTAP